MSCQRVQLVLRDDGAHRRDVRDLVAPWILILSDESATAATARLGPADVKLVHLVKRLQTEA
jgi:hypothetical protein